MKHLVSKLPMLMVSSLVFLCGCTQIQSSSQKAAPEAMLIADCVARYYKADESAYLTHQRHLFTPAQAQLDVIATEPTGQLRYSLRGNVFTAAQTDKSIPSDLPKSFFNKALATAIFYAMCGSSSLIEFNDTPSEEPVRILGQWYTPVIVKPNNDSAVLLQNQVTLRIEFVKVSQDGEIRWLARSSNFRYNPDLKTHLPQTIEVFDIGDGIASMKLVAQFEYRRFQAGNAQRSAGEFIEQ